MSAVRTRVYHLDINDCALITSVHCDLKRPDSDW